jgi:plastocyanin
VTGRGAVKAFCTASLSAAAWLSLAGPAYGVNTAVDVGNLFTFTPADITIDQGDTVTWRWVGPDVNHDVFSYPGEAEVYDSHPGIVAVEAPPGGTFAHTFTHVGTSRYFCSNHSSMQGTVTVHEAKVVSGPDSGTAGGGPAGQLGTKAKGCISQRKFKIRIRQPRGSSLRAASVTMNGRPVSVRKEDGRLTAQIDLRGFSTGTYDVRIKARTKGGRTLTGVRRYRTCAPKLTSSGLPRL